MQVDVAGAIKFAGRKFLVPGDTPKQRIYSKETQYGIQSHIGNVMGWVCVKSGHRSMESILKYQN